MYGIKSAAVVTGNIAGDDVKYFPAAGGRPVLASFVVLTNRRRRNPDTGQWEDAGEAIRTQVDVRGNAGEAVRVAFERGDLGRGVPVVVTGAVGDAPAVWAGANGAPRACNVIVADTVSVDLLRCTQRDMRRAASDERPAAAAQGAGPMPAVEPDPWGL